MDIQLPFHCFIAGQWLGKDIKKRFRLVKIALKNTFEQKNLRSLSKFCNFIAA
jgi:hypothetical protein